MEQKRRWRVRAPRQSSASIAGDRITVLANRRRGSESKVIALRKEFGWGARKLQLMLAEKNTSLARSRPSTGILERNGMVDQQSQLARGSKRFERAEPNELWANGFQRRLRSGRRPVLSALADRRSQPVSGGLYPLLRPTESWS